MEPPWSPPIAISASPVATSTPHPELEPPAERDLSYGLPTGPVAAVFDTPKAQTDIRVQRCLLLSVRNDLQFSHVAIPMI